MIFHMLCLFLMMMLVNTVIGAPGMDTTEEISRKDKSRRKSSGTLDSLGGGNILRLDSPDTETQNFRSLEMFVDYQDDAPQNMVLVVREDKQKPSSSGTLDSIGGGHLLRVVDSDLESEIFRSLDSFLENQDDMFHNMVSVDREDKTKTSSSGTLDSIGGGNLMGLVDSDTKTDTIRSLNLLLDNQNDIRQNMALVEDKQKPSSSGTLDPIGGGNLVRIVDPEAETEFFNSLTSFIDNKEEGVRDDKPTPKPASSGTLDPLGGGNLVRVTDSDGDERTLRSMESLVDNQEEGIREDKPAPKPASSGTLDPLGGGNFVRVTDSDGDEITLRSMESLVDNQGRQNMMRLAREDKSAQRSHALDGAGAGHLAGVTDPYRGQVFRSLDHSHLVDSLDQGGDVLRMLDSISGTDLLNSLDSQGVMAVLSALRKAQTKRMLDPKRMLDSVSGWTFGESKRNFDEIDNVGFTSFAKRNPRNPYYSKQLALAKKNFDEIDRAGFETYNKRDFDEIDRAGFETFEKRDRKE